MKNERRNNKIMKLLLKYLFITILLILISCNNQTEKEKLQKVANELIENDLTSNEISSTENIVFIGQSLKGKIAELKKQHSKIKIEFRDGDLNYPYGNFQADNILILDNSIQKVDVRLKYNDEKNKFDILGYKTE